MINSKKLFFNKVILKNKVENKLYICTEKCRKWNVNKTNWGIETVGKISLLFPNKK